MRRERRGKRGRADSRKAWVQAGARQNEYRAGANYECRGFRAAGAGTGGGALMTNTLHRFGPAESFRDDYVVFAISSRGKNDQGALPKLRRFLEMAVPFKPVNLGDAVHGGALRPCKDMKPTSHWKREAKPDFQAVIDGLDSPCTVAAVFDNRVAAEDFVKAVREADLGLSVNISTSVEGAEQCCFAAGIPRHSVGYSLGFEGKTERLPEANVMMLST